MEEGSCRQVPGCGISGRVGGADVSVGSQKYVTEGLDYREIAAADRFLEASTSQPAGNMQVSFSLQPRVLSLCTVQYTSSGKGGLSKTDVRGLDLRGFCRVQ